MNKGCTCEYYIEKYKDELDASWMCPIHGWVNLDNSERITGGRKLNKNRKKKFEKVTRAR